MVSGKYLIIVLSVALVAGLTILGYLANDQIQKLEEQNGVPSSRLADLQRKYGEVAPDHTTNSTYVKIDRVFVAPFGSELQNTGSIKAGGNYSVTAEFTRLDTNFGNKGSLDYVLVMQMRNESGVVQNSAWQSGLLHVGKSLSGEIYWTPAKAGNYTVEAFVLLSLRGTPLGPAQGISVAVSP